MAQQKPEREIRPPQQQDHQPGIETKMTPAPESKAHDYKSAGKLVGKAALVTGGDSGIGRSVSVMFAKEGADVVVIYLNEHGDAKETKRLIDQTGRKCLLIAGDIGNAAFCREVIQQMLDEFGRIDILVNNAGEQHVQEDFENITDEQLHRTFQTNVFSMFYLTREALRHMKPGASIVNTTSITAYQGNPKLIDYSATKGAVLAFTRALAAALADKGIRVNGVAPGPIWTPLIPSSFSEQDVAKFGSQTPLGRAGEPDEVAPSYVFLASDDASYITGQIIHPNGGQPVNG